jgi:hypothetical protein
MVEPVDGFEGGGVHPVRWTPACRSDSGGRRPVSVVQPGAWPSSLLRPSLRGSRALWWPSWLSRWPRSPVFGRSSRSSHRHPQVAAWPARRLESWRRPTIGRGFRSRVSWPTSGRAWSRHGFGVNTQRPPTTRRAMPSGHGGVTVLEHRTVTQSARPDCSTSLDLARHVPRARRQHAGATATG